ncbi:MAG: TonB-dependent receptor plug domain-containing protein, partial [Caulobacteraceae bacterium]
MRWVGLTVAAAAAVSTGAQAQTTEPASTTSPTVVESAVTPNPPEPTPLAAALKADPTLTSATGVTRYDPAFFAASQPTTAMDMLNHIPGFTFDGGDQVRGFAGAAGNVLLDGTRPTTKQDDLQSILRRVSASQVDHIDVIRGGAPGIDMQGKTVIANIVRKKGAGLTGTFAVAEDWLPDDGRDRKSIRLEGVKRWADGKVLEASILSGQFVDDGAGDGPRVRTDANGNVLIKSFLNTQGDGIQTNANTAFETPLAGGKFRINASLFMQPYDYREVDQLSFPTTDVITERDEQDRVNTELGAHYERAFGAKINFEGLVIRQDRQQDLIVNFNAPGDAEVFTQNNQSSETIGRAIVRYKYSDTLSFEAAAEGAFNALDS